MFLLDTNILSEPAKPLPCPKVIAWLEQMDEDRLLISAVSIAEIKHGISLLDKGRKKNSLTAWLENNLLPRFDRRIIPIDESISLVWGDLMGLSKRQGRYLSTFDGFIAATAKMHHLTLVTRNTKDFDFLSLNLFNPWDE